MDLIGFGLSFGNFLLGEFNEVLENGLFEENDVRLIPLMGCVFESYLDGSHIGILGDVFILIKTILGGFSLAQIDTEFNKEDHHRFQRRDRAASCSFRGDMFVKNCERGRSLAHSDEFPSPLYIKYCQ